LKNISLDFTEETNLQEFSNFLSFITQQLANCFNSTAKKGDLVAVQLSTRRYIQCCDTVLRGGNFEESGKYRYFVEREL